MASGAGTEGAVQAAVPEGQAAEGQQGAAQDGAGPSTGAVAQVWLVGQGGGSACMCSAALCNSQVPASA